MLITYVCGFCLINFYIIEGSSTQEEAIQLQGTSKRTTGDEDLQTDSAQVKERDEVGGHGGTFERESLILAVNEGSALTTTGPVPVLGARGESEEHAGDGGFLAKVKRSVRKTASLALGGVRKVPLRRGSNAGGEVAELTGDVPVPAAKPAPAPRGGRPPTKYPKQARTRFTDGIGALWSKVRGNRSNEAFLPKNASRSSMPLRSKTENKRIEPVPKQKLPPAVDSMSDNNNEGPKSVSPTVRTEPEPPSPLRLPPPALPLSPPRLSPPRPRTPSPRLSPLRKSPPRQQSPPPAQSSGAGQADDFRSSIAKVYGQLAAIARSQHPPPPATPQPTAQLAMSQPPPQPSIPPQSSISQPPAQPSISQPLPQPSIPQAFFRAWPVPPKAPPQSDSPSPPRGKSKDPFADLCPGGVCKITFAADGRVPPEFLVGRRN